MRQPLVPAGTRITNHFNKETFVFTHPYDGGASSSMNVVLEKGGSGGGNAIAHIHPKTDEIFTVRRGKLAVVIDGVEHIVMEGQSATVPAGRSHFFRNAHDGETEATVVFVTAQQHQRFFLNLAKWTAEQPAYFSEKGDVKLLAIAMFLDAYRDHLYIAGPPVWLQKIMFSVLAKLGWLAGYRLAVKPLAPAAVDRITHQLAFEQGA